jgi:hypothetical protein
MNCRQKISPLNLKPLYQSVCALMLVTAAVIAPVTPARAAYDASVAVDPPGRVGRLSDITGQVWMFSPGSGEWVAAVRNRPLTSGDRLSTDAGARAEMRIGSTTLRLDSGSELEVLQLDDHRTILQLHSGSTSVRLRERDTAAQFELRTAEGRFRVQRTGRYRFDRQDDTSHVTVYSGQAYFEGPGSALAVGAGQRAEFWLDNRNAAQYSLTEPVRDAFAAYNNERDQRDDRSVSARYVSPEMTGVEELDRHGRWEQNADYGPLWIPRVVAPDWAPYAAGRWAFVQPWGWTWIDDAPWGFAPFHYGRWVFLRNTWCWAPGSFVTRPVYAPALVAWVGGPRVSVGVSIGGGGGNFGASVGWFPLAPREVYVPTYRVSPRYVEQVNITHVTNITNITTIVNNPQGAVRDFDFANRKFHHAVTTVPEAVMTGRGNVAPAAAQWRAANPSPSDSQARNERGGRRNETSPAPVMTMAAPPVASPALQLGNNPPQAPVRQREFNPPAASMTAPTMSAPAAASAPAAGLPSPVPRMSRPTQRNGEEGESVSRSPSQRSSDRQPVERERAPEAMRPAPQNSPAPAAPSMAARPPAGQRPEPAAASQSRPVPSTVVPIVAVPSARMEGPRAPAREAVVGEPRKQSQDEKNDGRRTGPRAVD